LKGYLGIDVGSVSTNLVVLNEDGEIITNLYLRTQGKPIVTVQKGLELIKKDLNDVEIMGAGTTGSARHLTSVIVGADSVKNEITTHAVAASYLVPEVKTVLEIGGQDSKIILLRNGVVSDFAMNTVCAAGTGSFLDQQAARLNIPIEEFGEIALKATNPVRIAGRCSVFAESDMIHKQQMGHNLPDILAGLCEALVRNYLNNLGKGKEIQGPIVFQGGVAANIGIKKAFEKALETEIIIPKNFDVMGAVGAALLAKEAVNKTGTTNFKGFDIINSAYKALSFECSDCPNGCEVIEMTSNQDIIARWGDRCGKWANSISASSIESVG
jgi:predicted CoA-substrate-specific enzyme activase